MIVILIYKLANFKREFYNRDKYKTLIKFFDDCYDPIRYNDYEMWITAGMAIKNSFGNEGFDLFNYFSSKGNNYDGENKTRQKFNEFIYMPNDGYTIATLYKLIITKNIKIIIINLIFQIQ